MSARNAAERYVSASTRLQQVESGLTSGGGVRLLESAERGALEPPAFGDVFITDGDYRIDYKGHETRIYEKDENGAWKQNTRIWGDPHVDELSTGKGDDWHFGEDSTFILPDGTKLSLNTQETKPGNGIYFTVGIDIQSGTTRADAGKSFEDEMRSAGVAEDRVEFDAKYADTKGTSGGVFALVGGQWAMLDPVGFRGVEPESWKGYRPEIVKSPVVERVDGGDLRVTFIGHATVLIQIAGLNVLTDPIWAKRASPLSWAGPPRFAPPGLDLDELPPIDAVVVSHNHYDHLSVSTLRELTRRGVPLVLAPLGNKELLDRRGIAGARDLDWWETHRIDDGVSITCVPAQHFSGRGLSDRMATLWGGFVIETPDGVVYYAGDTGVGPHFAQVRERFGPPRLAVLPIGAYRPAWFMQPVHVDPREAAEAHLTLGARTSLAGHYGCFELADEGPTTPVLELDEACTSLGIPRDEFWTLAIGEARDAP